MIHSVELRGKKDPEKAKSCYYSPLKTGTAIHFHKSVNDRHDTYYDQASGNTAANPNLIFRILNGRKQTKTEIFLSKIFAQEVLF